MDPKAKKIVDAAMVWTDTPSVSNAGAIKSAVRVYREALKQEKVIVSKREADKPAATKYAPKKKRSGTPPGVHTSAFDTSDSEDKG